MTRQKNAVLIQKERIEALRKVFKQINSSKESAMAFLVKTGIYTKSGELSRNYK